MKMISCKCRCGNKLEKFDSKGRPRKYISGHQGRGQNKSEKWKQVMSINRRGKNNPVWKTDRSAVGRQGQDFSRNQKAKLLKKRCALCGSKKDLELDHIIPIFGGGTNEDKNAQTLCMVCNQRKRKKDLHRYRKLGRIKKVPHANYLGNLKPNSEGFVVVGKTRVGTIFGRKGTRTKVVKLKCSHCREGIYKGLWVVRGSKCRPAPKKQFCSQDCRIHYLNLHQRGKNNPFYGKTHSESSKRKISKSRKGKGLGNKNGTGYVTR